MIKMQPRRTEQTKKTNKHSFPLLAEKRNIGDSQVLALNKPSNSRGRTGHIPEEVRKAGITGHGKTQTA